MTHSRVTVPATVLRATRRVLGGRVPYRGLGRRLEQAGALPERVVVSVFGAQVELDLRQPIQRQILFGGAERFEHPTGPIVRGWLAEATAFFDMGANFGYFTYLAATARRDLPVWAFEPHPLLVDQLADSIRRNGWTGRVTVVEGALGDEPGTAELAVHEHGLEAGTLTPHPGIARTITVPVHTFDDWVARQELPMPSRPSWVVKIDVEGWEGHVLRGMERCLSAGAIGAVAIELNEFTLALAGTSAAEVRAQLNVSGFTERPVGAHDLNGFFVLER